MGESKTPDTASSDEERYAKIQERRRAWQYSAIGLQFGVSIAIGALGGNWLDGKFGTTPWLFLTGVIVGSASAFLELYRLAKKASRKP